MEYILDFDIETFNELLESVLRNEYSQKTEAAWTAMVAAQGSHKAMKSWVGQWKKIMHREVAETDPQDNNLREFLDMFSGKGF